MKNLIFHWGTLAALCVLASCSRKEKAVTPHVEEKPLKHDRLHLGATRVRTTELLERGHGSYSFEALKGNATVFSLEYSVRLAGGHETCVILGRRVDASGATRTGVIVYDETGTLMDNLSPDPIFGEGLKWLVAGDGEQLLFPAWSGVDAFSLGSDKWELITVDTCPPCTSGIFCNC